MAALKQSGGKPGGSDVGLSGGGRIENQQGVIHEQESANKKPRFEPGFLRKDLRSVIATKSCQQMQQMDEQVVDVEVQRHRGADVVGLAAVNDAAGVPQDHA